MSARVKGRLSDRARQILKQAADEASREMLPIRKAKILDTAAARVRKMHPDMFRQE